MEILTGQEMRNVDRRAIDVLGIPGRTLMEAAGRAVAETLLRDYPDLAERGVLIVCGKGNNGGDGFVTARHLHAAGITPRVLLLAAAAAVQGDAAANLAAARDAGLEIHEVPDNTAWSRVHRWPEESGIILDAILGTGVRGGARGLAATAIEAINDARRSGSTVVAIDLPSGLDADAPQVEGLAVQADRTYTLCRPKPCLLLLPASELAGRMHVLPIGIPDEAVLAEQPSLEWLDAAAAKQLLPPRAADSHKGTFGHLLTVAGSRDKSGAAVLVARGALRAGVGLVTVATPTSARPLVAAQQAEVMTEALAESSRGSLSRRAVDRALGLLTDRTALAIGPGLGTASGTSEAVAEILAKRKVPAVLDADGLNAFASGPTRSGRRLKAGRRELVLTPHPGEAARLLGRSSRKIQQDRLAAARRLAERTGSVVVLKGHRSLVAEPGGHLAINASGNPGMATAGTGDVLTGVVGALLARGMVAWDAARLATWVHGRAGDLARERRGEEGLIASDVVDHLPDAFRELQAS